MGAEDAPVNSVCRAAERRSSRCEMFQMWLDVLLMFWGCNGTRSGSGPEPALVLKPSSVPECVNFVDQSEVITALPDVCPHQLRLSVHRLLIFAPQASGGWERFTCGLHQGGKEPGLFPMGPPRLLPPPGAAMVTSPPLPVGLHACLKMLYGALNRLK